MFVDPSGATMQSPTLRRDLQPLCPDHFEKMEPGVAGKPDSKYACTKRGCAFCWQWDTGYFLWEDGEVELPPNATALMRPALDSNHGYLYIASIHQGQRVWKCPVQDCPNTLVDES